LERKPAEEKFSKKPKEKDLKKEDFSERLVLNRAERKKDGGQYALKGEGRKGKRRKLALMN